jgi:hypothetical protein
LASVAGIYLTARINRSAAKVELQRGKLEEFCGLLQEAMFHVSLVLTQELYQTDTTPPSAENSNNIAVVRRLISRTFVIERLYFPGKFGEAYKKVVDASSIVGVITEDGQRGFSRKRLAELTTAMHELNVQIWKQFKVVC